MNRIGPVRINEMPNNAKEERKRSGNEHELSIDNIMYKVSIAKLGLNHCFHTCGRVCFKE